jgi:hypothetical protein
MKNTEKLNLKVILKADDFCPVTLKSLLKSIIKFDFNSMGFFHGLTVGWKNYIKFSYDQNISTDFGIVGNSLKYLSKNSTFVKETKILLSNNNGIWNHGYYHMLDEFKNRSLKSQVFSISNTNLLLKKLFKIKNITFGAPGNNIDENTNKAIINSGNNIWFFGNKKDNKYISLDRIIDVEEPTGSPNFKFFTNEVSNLKNKKIDIIILQIHPNKWKENDYLEFSDSLELLSSHFNVEYITSASLIEG